MVEQNPKNKPKGRPHCCEWRQRNTNVYISQMPAQLTFPYLSPTSPFRSTFTVARNLCSLKLGPLPHAPVHST